MTFRVVKFWTVYTPDGIDGDGKPKLKSVDMVAYCPIGKASQQVAVETVSRLGKVQPIEKAQDNPAVQMAHHRWNVIKPAYDAWKNGQSIPENGIPLGAWPGVSTDQAEALRTMGLRTVEEIAEASDGIITKLPFPGGRELRAAAKAYLGSSDKMKVAAEMTGLQQKNHDLESQLEEMRLILIDMQKAGSIPASTALPKRRGRPPKSDEVAAA